MIVQKQGMRARRRSLSRPFRLGGALSTNSGNAGTHLCGGLRPHSPAVADALEETPVPRHKDAQAVLRQTGVGAEALQIVKDARAHTRNIHAIACLSIHAITCGQFFSPDANRQL